MRTQEKSENLSGKHSGKHSGKLSDMFAQIRYSGKSDALRLAKEDRSENQYDDFVEEENEDEGNEFEGILEKINESDLS